VLYFQSYEPLLKNVYRAVSKSSRRPFLILLGGCSRTGKSTLSLRLSKDLERHDLECNIVNLDSWIISLEKRNSNGNVLERFDCNAIVKEISNIMQGNVVYPPVYDSLSRRRVKEKGEKCYCVSSGVVIVEGVIALAIKELVNISSLKMFIFVPDKIRIQKLLDFYINIKALDRNMAIDIILSREIEEVPLVKDTSKYADLIVENKDVFRLWKCR